MSQNSGQESRPIPVGDTFALLVGEASGPVPGWQERLQASLGGSCMHPLHITCQRVSPDGDARLQVVCRVFREALAPLREFAVYGDHLEIWYSEWRDRQIAKCLVRPVAELATAVSVLDSLLDEHGIQRHYRVDDSPELIPITVLEGVSDRPSLGDGEQHLVQRHLFSPAELAISRTVGHGRFEILERIPLAPPA